MKKFLLSCLGLLAFWSAAQAASEEEMIAFIAETGAARSEVKSAFTEVRSFPRKAAVTLKGELLYKQDYLHMAYEDAQKENFLIDGNSMVNRREGREIKSDLSRNALMRSLANTLLYAFSGQLETLSKEQKTSLTVSSDGDTYKAVLDAQQKLPRGYSHIEIRYRKSDGQIVSMTMDEFTGQSTYYQLGK
ncbi:MAG: hypothetical protein J6Y32_05250 [Bacteroidales bacterium]|nr:hypothetical protein [Bacteroidales bacterium]